MTIIICDDEQVEREYLSALVRKWAEKMPYELAAFNSAESFLFYYDEKKAADILLLDIQMEGMDGMALARRVREDHPAAQIIFVTGYPDYMSEGFEVSALHYLMKPVSEEKLFQTLNRAAARLSQEEKAVVVETRNGQERLFLRDIACLEAFSREVEIRLMDGRRVFSTLPIGKVETMLDTSFCRCHRSYVVGLRHIGRITKTEIVLDNGEAIPLSRRLYRDVNQAFISFYKEEG